MRAVESGMEGFPMMFYKCLSWRILAPVPCMQRHHHYKRLLLDGSEIDGRLCKVPSNTLGKG